MNDENNSNVNPTSPQDAGELNITAEEPMTITAESETETLNLGAIPAETPQASAEPEKNTFEGDIQAELKKVSLPILLDLVIDQKASDLHLSAGERIGLRLDGEVRFVENIPKLDEETARRVICEGLMKNNPEMIKKYEEGLDSDFAYTHVDGTPFRVNAFYKRGNMAVVLRRINQSAFTFEQLGLPPAVETFCKAKSGLVLVCGPTGSGKSSSLAAMIEWVNENRHDHIITIEDPIEYIFESKRSVISQREIGRDTKSFANALRALLREDPDVAMIGELRDPETIMTAIELCETGHLVFGTFHTGSAAQTVNRLIANFPPSAQSAVSVRLADALIGVLCQRLIPKIGGGRTAIFELVTANGAIRNLIRNNDMAQIDSVIQTSGEAGMISMKRYAEQKRAQGLIEEKDYVNFFQQS